MTIHGGGLKKRKGKSDVDFSTLPQPEFATDLAQPWNILVTGIGGTGVVTIGALIGMAAHLENKGATVLDQTGLAQKGGAVTCHLRIARAPGDIHAVRIAAGEADLVLGCDMVVVNDYWALSKIRAARSRVVLNTYEAMPGTFTTRPDMQFPAAADSRRGEDRARRRGTRTRRRDRAGDEAARRLDREQPVHARLCLAEGLGAADATSR